MRIRGYWLAGKRVFDGLAGERCRLMVLCGAFLFAGLPVVAAPPQMATGQSFTCDVRGVHDGDGPIYCSSGIKIRVRYVQAPDYESAEPCRRGRPGYVCDDAAADRAKAIAARLVAGKRLTCEKSGTSWKRVVATCSLPDGRDLSCALVRSGAATIWPKYDRGSLFRRRCLGDR